MTQVLPSPADQLRAAMEVEVEKMSAKLTPRAACVPSDMGRLWVPDSYKPHPQQRAFLLLDDVEEVVFGGAGGGGKSFALLMEGLKYVCVPGHNGIILRRTHKQLTGGEGLIPRSHLWLGGTAAKWLGNGPLGTDSWIFPSGATLKFGYAEQPADKLRYQGDTYQYIAFDELTMWPDDDVYTYLLSRNRSDYNRCEVCTIPLDAVPDEPGRFRHKALRTVATEFSAVDVPTTLEPHEPVSTLPFCDGCGLTVADIPIRTRSATNPGSAGHGWVRSYFNLPHGMPAYIDETGMARPERPFIESRLIHNPSMNAEQYARTLAGMKFVERERILRGDWSITEAGRMFSRGWVMGE